MAQDREKDVIDLDPDSVWDTQTSHQFIESFGWRISEATWIKRGRLRLTLSGDDIPGSLKVKFKVKTVNIVIGELENDGFREGARLTIRSTDVIEENVMITATMILHNNADNIKATTEQLKRNSESEIFHSIMVGEFKFREDHENFVFNPDEQQLYDEERGFYLDVSIIIQVKDSRHVSDISSIIPASMGDFVRDMQSIVGHEGTTDFSITCNGKKFMCHKNVLSARSEYFKKMFESNTIEKIMNNLDIKASSYTAVGKMLWYIYSGEQPYLLYYQDIVDLLQLADMYMLKTLKLNCGETIINHLTIDNCISSFIIISRYFPANARLKELVKLFLRCKAMQVVESEDWEKLDKEFQREVVRAMVQGGKEVHDCLFCN